MSLLLRALAAVAASAVACITVHGQATEPAGAAPLADTVLWGLPMAPAWRIADLPRDIQEEIASYRQRERTFRSGLKAPRGATAVERELFDKRVAIERVLFCLFPRRDIARVAASFASDAEVAPGWEGQSDAPRREAAFIDGLLPDLQQPWLAPYLNLIAGHRKLCASQLQGSESQASRQALAEDAKRQLARARDGQHPIIRVVANHLLVTPRCVLER